MTLTTLHANYLGIQTSLAIAKILLIAIGYWETESESRSP